LSRARRRIPDARQRAAAGRVGAVHPAARQCGPGDAARAHARIRGGRLVELSFPGKSGQPWESQIDDAELAALIAGLKRRGGRALLLSWREDGDAVWRPLRAADVNDDVRRRTGGEFTAKDFRTLHGTIAAAEALARIGPRESVTARKRAVAAAIRETAAILGNTPAVARASYVDPRVI